MVHPNLAHLVKRFALFGSGSLYCLRRRGIWLLDSQLPQFPTPLPGAAVFADPVLLLH
jgi:hypothetical protein